MMTILVSPCASPRLLGAIAGGSLVFLSISVPTGANPSPPNQNRGVAIVTAMVKGYQRMQSFEQTSRHSMKMESQGRSEGKEVQVRFVHRKPNRLLYRVDDPQGGVTLTCNGKKLWVYSKSQGRYAVQDAPPDMRQMKKVLGQWGLTYMDPLAFLQGVDPFNGVTSVRYLGVASLNGVSVEMIELHGAPRELRMPKSVTTLYIGKADRLLYKTMTRASAFSPPSTPLPGARPIRSTLVLTKTFGHMKIDAPAPDTVFLFTPPHGAQQSASL